MQSLIIDPGHICQKYQLMIGFINIYCGCTPDYGCCRLNRVCLFCSLGCHLLVVHINTSYLKLKVSIIYSPASFAPQSTGPSHHPALISIRLGRASFALGILILRMPSLYSAAILSVSSLLVSIRLCSNEPLLRS